MNDYLTKTKRKGYGKYTWRLNPPEDLVKAGIAKPQTFHDGRIAQGASKKLVQKVKDFRSGKLVGKNLPDKATMEQLVAHYTQSTTFLTKSKNTKEAYLRDFNTILKTPIRSTTVGRLKVKDLNSKTSAMMFEEWSKNSNPPAVNDRKRSFGVLMNHAILHDLLTHNPMHKVQRLPHQAKVHLWTRDQVEAFVTEAFKDFKYRSIGLVVLLCYEWGQRPVDICQLKWDNLNLDEDTVTITQQKTGVTVYLPIEPRIKQLLLKQKEDFDFQEYVAPILRKSDNAWRPMDSPTTSRLLREVKQLAGLPSELQLRGLRSTAITEMVESNVEITQIKQVTGHKNIASLNPYVKNTRKGAASALSMRKGNQS